jgi:hypothetical protein
MADPDAVPMTDEEWAEAPRVARVKTIRRALKLSQEEKRWRLFGPRASPQHHRRWGSQLR